MNILIIGNGGREHALAWKASQSKLADKIFVAPGNAGTAQEAKVENVAILPTDITSLLSFAKKHDVGLTIVGPEAPLVIGVVDTFQSYGLKIFGPSRAAAQLEGSKSFTKAFLDRHQIPCAKYQCFHEMRPALDYVRKKSMPIVIKVDGLAAGKGVIVATTLTEAEKAIRSLLGSNTFGHTDSCIILEEFLVGEEVSFIVMVDGEHVVPMASTQDHKRLGDGDTGPNTGGMGAYSPVTVVTHEIYQRIMNQIIWPTIHGMRAEGNIYTGFLYAGLMITSNSQPKVIEFNCRLGDPETQALMLRLRSDLIELCLAGTEGKLDKKTLEWDKRSALGVVLATNGYPGSYRSGEVIYGLSQKKNSDYKIFHAGTRTQGKEIVTDGGRVLCVAALGATLEEAQQRAYQLQTGIQWQNSFCRKDIGYRAIARARSK